MQEWRIQFRKSYADNKIEMKTLNHRLQEIQISLSNSSFLSIDLGKCHQQTF